MFYSKNYHLDFTPLISSNEINLNLMKFSPKFLEIYCKLLLSKFETFSLKFYHKDQYTID